LNTAPLSAETSQQPLLKAPAVRGWTVCRFHGVRGGGPKGKRNGMYRHGLYTKEAIQERRFLRELDPTDGLMWDELNEHQKQFYRLCIMELARHPSLLAYLM
jgi:hypothetical protein